jgi:hypothetical protein
MEKRLEEQAYQIKQQALILQVSQTILVVFHRD